LAEPKRVNFGERKMRRYTLEEIYDMDRGKWASNSRYVEGGGWTFCNDKLRYVVARALSRAPSRVVDFLYKKCFFIMPVVEEGGIYIPKSAIRNKDLILLPEGILYEDPENANHIILHEAAHCHLRHKSPAIGSEEYNQQESQAEKFANRWLEQSEKERRKNGNIR
jgi:hypothetical protein